MKKFLLTVMVIGGTLAAVAAPQYNVSWGAINVNEPTNLTIDFEGKNALRGYNSFGYQVQNIYTGEVRFETFKVYSGQPSLALGSFEAGDRVSLFVTKGNHVVANWGIVTNRDGSYTLLNVYNNDINFSIGASGGAPNGQPLPGVMGSVLLGAAVVGACRKFKKRRA